MPLDYLGLSRQVGDLRDSLVAALDRRVANLARAVSVYQAPHEPADWIGPRLAAASADWRRGRPLETPIRRVPAAPPPADFVVVATDGSQIEADRHHGIECHLLNLGLVTLRYGPYAGGRLDVTSRILFEDKDLYLADPNRPSDRQKIEGQLFAATRTIAEMRAVVDLAAAAPDELPVLALQDGTLTLWNLLGSQHRQFVSQALLHDPERGFLPVLDRARELAERRPLLLAGYISRSSNAEVVNLLRHLECDKPTIDCGAYCGQLPRPAPGRRTCDSVDGVYDRDLFAEILDYGERSAIFATDSADLARVYGPHATCFFYLNVGTEIARVEIPGWLAESVDRVRLVHHLILDQVERGLGYPAALIEAHERAVVRAADRDEFTHLIERELIGARPRLPASEKYVSKRLRAV